MPNRMQANLEYYPNLKRKVIYKPVTEKEIKEHAERLKYLDETIKEIDLFLENYHFDPHDELGSKLTDIVKKLNLLKDFINDPEIKIHSSSLFCDKIGNFNATLGLLKFINNGVNQEILQSYLSSVDDLKTYLKKCIDNHDFLKKQLENNN